MTDVTSREATSLPSRPSRLANKPLTIVSPKINLGQRLRALWRYRELLIGMTRKDLRVMYKDSVLGFLWSMLNPAVTMLVYYVVFQLILKNGVPRFAVFLMSGVLAWNFFSAAAAGACGSVVFNANIIKKVAFPREIPALAQVGAALVQLGYQSVVLIIFMAIFRRGPAVEYLPLLIPALAALVLFTAALGTLLAAINVRMRDIQHLLSVALNVWFWATPIVYQYRMISDRVSNGSTLTKVVFVLYRFNPITPIVLAFQRALYGATSPAGAGGKPVPILPDHAGPWWYLWQLLAVIGFSLALGAYSLHVFGHRERSFAEEL